MTNNEDLFKKIIGHCKEYGFVFQSSEIYDGLSAAYDYGPNGVELKNPQIPLRSKGSLARQESSTFGGGDTTY